jgi:hypothetical protein
LCDYHSSNTIFYTIGVHLEKVACPFSGQYKVTSGDLGLGSSAGSVDCPFMISSCTNSHTINLNRQCGKQTTGPHFSSGINSNAI